jgi:hypothetical protein
MFVFFQIIIKLNDGNSKSVIELNESVTLLRKEKCEYFRFFNDKRQQKLQEMTDTFRARVVALWDLRWFIFEQPMMLLVGFLFRLARDTLDSLGALQAAVEQARIRSDFLLDGGCCDGLQNQEDDLGS